MFSDYNEKAAYEQHCRSRRGHSKSSSTTSNVSTSSSSSDLNEKPNPPAYASIFYNSINEKPLPRIPTSSERRVRFAIEKPLPPLPSENGDEYEDEKKRMRRSHDGGEYAWFAQGRRREVEIAERWDEKLEF